MIRWREFPSFFLFFFFSFSSRAVPSLAWNDVYNYCTRLYMADRRAYGNANSTAVPRSGNSEGSAGMWFLATRVNRPLQLCVVCAWRLNPASLCRFFSFFFFYYHSSKHSLPLLWNYSLWKITNNRNNSLPPFLDKKKYRIMLRYRDKSRYIDRFSVRRKHLRGRKIPFFLFFVKIADEHESNEQFLAVERRGRPASSSFPLHNFACTASYCRISSREETGERETVTKRNRWCVGDGCSRNTIVERDERLLIHVTGEGSPVLR